MTRHALSWMDDRIAPVTVENLQQAWTINGGEPAWMGRRPAAEDDPQPRGEWIRDRMSDLIDGASPEEAALMTADVDDWKALIDPLALSLARRTGTDMLSVLAALRTLVRARLTIKTLLVPITRGAARRSHLAAAYNNAHQDFGTRADVPERVTLDVPLAPGVTLRGAALHIDRVLPHAMLTRLKGERLARLVSHPDLDPLELVVLSAETLPGAKGTRLLTSHDVGGVEIATLTRDASAAEMAEPPRRRRVADARSLTS